MNRGRWSRARPSRRFLPSFMAFALVVALSAMTQGQAEARSEDLVAFADDSRCEVVMNDIHASHRPVGDVSVHTVVRCFRANSSAPMTVDSITVTTRILHSLTGLAFIDSKELGTCGPTVRSARSEGEFPCHAPPEDHGTYLAEATVEVSVAGMTEEVKIEDSREFDPSAIA